MVGAATDIVAKTAEPAFACDLDGRLLTWNDAAAGLLGHRPEQAIGVRCFNLLRGVDVFGNRFCTRQCPLRSMSADGEAVHRFDVWMRPADGVPLLIRVIPVVVDDHAEGVAIVHVLERREPSLEPPVFDGDPGRSAGSTEPIVGLTRREREVLELLIQGAGTDEIADTLYISVPTVRTHIQSILQKTGTHSRLEVVALAMH